MADQNELLQKAMVDVQFMEGETMEAAWQADGFFLGTNPLLKLMAIITSFLVRLTGGHIRIFLVVTNLRLVMVQSKAQWCGCMSVRDTNTIALSSLKEAGINKETQYCCFHSRAVHLQSITQRYTMVVRKFKDENLRHFLAQMSYTIIRNSKTM
jgi:hypothetical protein